MCMLLCACFFFSKETQTLNVYITRNCSGGCSKAYFEAQLDGLLFLISCQLKGSSNFFFKKCRMPINDALIVTKKFRIPTSD